MVNQRSYYCVCRERSFPYDAISTYDKFKSVFQDITEDIYLDEVKVTLSNSSVEEDETYQCYFKIVNYLRFVEDDLNERFYRFVRPIDFTQGFVMYVLTVEMYTER